MRDEHDQKRLLQDSRIGIKLAHPMVVAISTVLKLETGTIMFHFEKMDSIGQTLGSDCAYLEWYRATDMLHRPLLKVAASEKGEELPPARRKGT